MLYNANTGKYLYSLVNASTDGQNSTGLTDDINQAEKISIDLKTVGESANGTEYNLRNADSHVMQSEGDGRINYWDSAAGFNQGIWKIAEAEDINVNLNSSAADEASFASVYFPFDIASVSGATMYTGELNAEKNAVVLNEATEVPAYTPVILKGAADAASATLTIAAATATSNTNAAILGTTVNLTVDANSVMTLGRAGSEGKVGFYTFSGTSVAANRVYMNIPENGANALRFVFGEDETTGVEGVEVNTPADQAPVYDLSGRRVNRIQKGGLYIKNGVKYIAQ